MNTHVKERSELESPEDRRWSDRYEEPLKPIKCLIRDMGEGKFCIMIGDEYYACDEKGEIKE